ncbi:MAG: thioredoxin TrxC [Devosia sp.]
MNSDNLVVCVACGAVNRMPSDKPAAGAKCGACGVALFAGKPADVDGGMFDRQIAKSSLPVVVDVWAPWCGPCRVMGPQYEDAARSLEPSLRFLKLNSDNEQSTAARLGIRGIPTMLLFKDGTEIGRVSGAMSASQIGNWISGQLPSRSS